MFDSLRIGTKETHEIFTLRVGFIGIVQSSRIFSSQFLTHFLFQTNLRVWVFKCKLQIRVGGRGPDSYSETSQVSSYCLDASYEHARACSTQSPKRILPLSYFILQPERGYNSLRIGTKETHEIFTLRVGFIGIVQSRRKSIGLGLSNLCTPSVLTRQKLATCYSTDKKCQNTFTSFFLTQVSYDVLDKENLGNQAVCLFS